MERFSNGALNFQLTDTGEAGSGQAGSGQAVILLHGFPQDRRCWDRVAPGLAEGGYRVLAPDLRGYSPGARPAARSAYRNSELATDVLALADAAGAERFHLAGHDWGAALAWYVAGRHPDRVASLAALSVPHPQAFGRAMVSSRQAARSWYMAAWQLPWLPERALSRRGGQVFRDTLVRMGLDPASADRYATRARDPDGLRGPLNWYRAMPFSMREPARSRCRPCTSGATATSSSPGPPPNCAAATSPGRTGSWNSTAPRTGCPNGPRTGWRPCWPGTSPRRPRPHDQARVRWGGLSLPGTRLGQLCQGWRAV